jgi:hypothetical protein
MEQAIVNCEATKKDELIFPHVSPKHIGVQPW